MRKLAILTTLIVVISLLHSQGVSAATTRWVNDDAASYVPPGNNCNVAGYATIQAAIAASNPGDVINVCPGTYTENDNINKSITVKSTAGAAVTIVNAAISAHVFDITAANVTLQGLTIVPGGFADPDIGVNLAVDGVANASILLNVVNGGRIGINLGCASDGNTVANNTVNGQTEAGINIDTCEISPDNALNPGSDRNQVHHNTACSNTSTGSIALGGSVMSNHVHHNTATKISVFGKQNEIDHNTTQIVIVDNNAPNNNLHDNVVDPTICTQPPSQPTLVWECFELQDGDNPNVPIRLFTRNFGWDGVTVTRAVRMCEPALKTRGSIPGGTVTVSPNSLMTLRLLDPGNNAHTLMLAGSMGSRVALGGPDTAPEILALDLQSIAPISPSAGPSNALLASFFDVFLELDASKRSSFFDVFTEISIDRQDGRGSLTAMPDRALHFGQPNAGGEMTLEGTYRLIGPNGDTGISITGGSFTPNPPYTRVVECYRTPQGADPNNAYDLLTSNFGHDQVIVRLSTSFCEGAIKSVEQPPANLLPPPLVWQCFNVAQGETPGVLMTLQTRNFGFDQVPVRKLVTLCEDARKVRPVAGGLTSVGEPTGRVYACYQITGEDKKAPYVLTTRNFGPDRVTVRRPNLMCEPAKKTPIFGNPPGEENVTITDSPDS